MRGSGNSDGLLLDEYLPQEQLDGAEVIAWLAEPAVVQRGRRHVRHLVGRLQRAADRGAAATGAEGGDQPLLDRRPLRRRRALHGRLPARAEVLGWASFMLGLNALPPDPEHVGERWRALWLERLEGTPPFIEDLAPPPAPRRVLEAGLDLRGLRGGRTCPVYMVGGWADALHERDSARARRAVGGRHAVQGADRAVGARLPRGRKPGPQIGFLQESLRWWDHWLKGEETGIMEEPLLRAWIQQPVAPATSYAMRPGRWVAEEAWPSPRIAPRRFWLTADRGPRGHAWTRRHGRDARPRGRRRRQRHVVPLRRACRLPG
jgi:predicted acyl esterase